jgi:hypothetical protein
MIRDDVAGRERPSPTLADGTRDAYSRRGRCAGRRPQAGLTPGLIRFGDAGPALLVLRAHMRASDDLPAAYVRLLYGLPDETPVASRVDQLSERNSAKSRKSDVLGADERQSAADPPTIEAPQL